MRRATAIGIAAAVGAALAVAYFALDRTTTVPPGSRETSPEQDTTRSPSPEARTADAPQGGESAPSVTAPAPSAEPGSLAEPNTTADAPSLREPAAAADTTDLEPTLDDHAASYLRVADRFRGERRDPTTAVALEREILDRFAGITGLEVTTLDVECRTTTCRVRMAERPGQEFRKLPGPGGFADIVDGFGTAVGTVTEAPDGSTIFEWLLARDANPLKR